ncbi:MAG: gliding motility protein GldN [Muribaculaceae bacterium]|nr:gliding motility protein GldN [Muribaculaceae bacterium]
MKIFKLIAISMLLCFTASLAQAQVTKRTGTGSDRGKKDDNGTQVTDRQQSFYEIREPSDADLQWVKVVYRQLDLTKGKNPALYYPEEPNEDGQSLFFIIMRLLADNKISAYEYLDGKEIFSDEYKIKVPEMLDRFHVLYTDAKGSSEKNPKYTIEDADIPSNEILSYFIIEHWEFDTRTNNVRTRVEALCPVLHRQDDYGGEPIRFPMFWVRLNDIRPYMAQQYVFTDDDNNLPKYNLDDFFKLNMYDGEIYKVKNLRNLSLAQMYPDEEKLAHARDSIEKRLHSFDKNLWVPSREELQAMADAKKQQSVEEGEDGENKDGDKKDEEKAEKKKPKRAQADGDNKKNKKVKNRKPKTAKSSSSSGNSGATRSVRNRKR